MCNETQGIRKTRVSPCKGTTEKHTSATIRPHKAHWDQHCALSSTYIPCRIHVGSKHLPPKNKYFTNNQPSKLRHAGSIHPLKNKLNQNYTKNHRNWPKFNANFTAEIRKTAKRFKLYLGFYLRELNCSGKTQALPRFGAESEESEQRNTLHFREIEEIAKRGNPRGAELRLYIENGWENQDGLRHDRI